MTILAGTVKTRWCVAMAVFLLFSGSARSQDLVLYTENYPPYNYLDENGGVAGLATQKVRQVMEESGLTYEIRLVPWTRAVYHVRTQDNALIYSMTRTPKRENDYDWLVPLAISNFHLFVRADETRAVTPEALAAGVFVGACVNNDLGCELLRWANIPPEKIVRLPSENMVDFRMVIAGRADIYISDLSVNNRLRQLNGFDPGLTKPAMRLGSKAGFYLASGKQVSSEKRRAVRVAYDRLMAAGRYSLAEPTGVVD